MTPPARYMERKFVLSMLPMLVGSVALFSGGMDGGQYSVLVMGILGGYSLNKWADGKGGSNVPPAP